MSKYELAQLNIALLKSPIDSPDLADFVDNLDRINALAESSPGYVWRLQTDEGNATAIKPLGDDYIVNLTVWKPYNPSLYAGEGLHDLASCGPVADLALFERLSPSLG